MKFAAFLAAVTLLAPLAALAQDEAPKSMDKKDVKKLCDIVEHERGLTFKKQVKVQFLSEKDLKANLAKNFDEEWPEEKAKKDEKAYKKLGVIPQDMDLRQTMLDMMAESIGGYYDPKSKQLFLITRDGNSPGQMNDMMKKMYGIDWDTMATIHELTHAMQDQYYDLQTIPTDMEGNDDLVKGMQCLFEGEANYVMYSHVFSLQGVDLRKLPGSMLRASGAQGTPKMMAAPEILKRDLGFPYLEGMAFAHDVVASGEAWEKVDECYTKKLPLSTEQVLHPEKFCCDAPDWPQLVTLPDLASPLGKGWTLLESNVMGELNVQVLLGEYISRKKSPKTIARSAAGWDGDRFAVYEKGDATALAWFTTWDSEKDAQEFFASAKKCLVKKLAAEGTADGDDVATWDGGSVLERKGQDVLWLETAGKNVDKARQAIWAGTTKKEISTVERKKATQPVEDAPPAKDAPLAENDSYRLTKGPKAAWKVDENGTDVTITWKGMDGAVSFHLVSKKNRDAEKALDQACESAEGELTDAKRRSWAVDGLDDPSGGVVGKSEELGDVKMGIIVLDSGKKWVVARLACTSKAWDKASKEFEKIVKGFEAK